MDLPRPPCIRRQSELSIDKPGGPPRNQMKTRVTIALALLAAASVALLLNLRSGSAPSGEKQGHQAPGSGSHVDLPADPKNRINELSVSGPDRRPVTSRPSLHIEDDSGNPLPGAEVSWTVMTNLSIGEHDARPRTEWSAIDGATTHYLTDTHGNVEPEAWASSNASSQDVIWVTHGNHFAVCTGLDAVLADSSRPYTLSTAEGPDFSIRVVGVDRRPIEEAVVHLQFDLDRRSMSHSTPRERQLKSAFHRVVRTSKDGVAHLPPLQGSLIVYAEKGALRSTHWVGTSPKLIELMLGPSFQAYGSIQASGDNAPLDKGMIRVRADRGDEWVQLGRYPVRRDGNWGPIALPLITADRYMFRLEDTQYIPDAVYLPSPREGEQLKVDMHPVLGISVTTKITTASGTPLANTSVTAIWPNDNTYEYLTEYSNDDGLAYFQSCKPGEIDFSAEHAGYVGSRTGWLRFNATPAEPIAISLGNAVTLRGVCTHSAAPVRDYDIYYWTQDPARSQREEIRDSADGSFAISTLPPGEISLFAMSSNLGRSDTVKVNLSATPTPPVELRLSTALRGTGRVVDAITNEPVLAATVQSLIFEQGVEIGKWQGPKSVNASGRFEFDGFSTGTNLIEVAAPGFTARRCTSLGTTGPMVDFGTIGLWKGCVVRARLDAGVADNCSRFYFDVFGSSTTLQEPFSSECEAISEPVAPGRAIARCIFPNSVSIERYTKIESGHDSTVHFRASPARPLMLTVVPEPERAFAGHTTARIHYVDGEDVVDIVIPLQSWSPVDISFVEPSRFTIDIYDSESTALLGHHIVNQADLLAGNIVVRLGEGSVFTQTIDGHGVPVRDATVTVATRAGDSVVWSYTGKTDENGRLAFEGLTARRADFMLTHATLGTQLLRDVELESTESAPVILTFDPRAELDIQLADHGGAIPPVDGEIVNAIGESAGVVFSSASGELHFANIGAEQYTFSIDHPGLWPTRVVVHAEPNPKKTVVQVRRLGSLKVLVTRGGLPWTGVAVDLDSAEFGESARAWAQGGRVIATPSSLNTDSAGRVRLDGLPHGVYRVRLTSPTGESFQSEVTVKPGEVVDQTVAVQ